MSGAKIGTDRERCYRGRGGKRRSATWHSHMFGGKLLLKPKQTTAMCPTSFGNVEAADRNGILAVQPTRYPEVGMASLNGTSKEMEAQARRMKRSILVEIANRNDSPQAMKARAELDRRDQVMVCWIIVLGVVAAAAAVAGAVLSGISLMKE